MRSHLAMIAALAACGGSPAPAPAANEAREEPREALDEATGDEPATARSDRPTIDAPSGWRLAREGATIVVKASASPAVIALTTLPLASSHGRIQEEANALAASVDVTVRGTIRLKDLAEQSVMAGSRKLALWELPYAEREGQNGAILVIAGKLSDEAVVVGIAYALNDDEPAIEAILDAITTIRPGASP